MIKNLVFDFGRVLLDYDFSHILDPLFDNEQERQEFTRLYTSRDFVNKCDLEIIPFEQIIAEEIQRMPQYTYQLNVFRDRYTEFVTGEVPGMRDLLAKLKDEGFRLYGITNWCSKVHEVIQDYPEIFSLLEGWVISSEEKLLKPAPQIYQVLLDRFHLRPEDCVFTDDRPENVEGALRLGMKGIVFRNAEQYEQDLRQMLAEFL